MEGVRFDLRALFEAVDAERQKRGMTWAALSGRVGVSVSTIRRFGTAADAEADGVLALIRWLGSTPEDYVEEGRVPGERLRRPGPGFVRVDMGAVAAAADLPDKARGRSRTTIQNLVAVAQQADRPVASLTRLTPT